MLVDFDPYMLIDNLRLWEDEWFMELLSHQYRSDRFCSPCISSLELVLSLTPFPPSPSAAGKG